MDSKVIAERIKVLMKSKNMTIKKLAEELQISYPTLTKKLRGTSEFCNTDIAKFIEIFDLDIDLCANIFFNPTFNIEEKINKTKKIS